MCIYGMCFTFFPTDSDGEICLMESPLTTEHLAAISKLLSISEIL